MVVEPVRLDGRIVRLEPMEDRHRPGLMAAGLADPAIWRWTIEWIETPDALETYLAAAERARDDGTQLPFVTIDQRSDEVIGSSRFFGIDHRNRNLEIGYTWLMPSRQPRVEAAPAHPRVRDAGLPSGPIQDRFAQ